MNTEHRIQDTGEKITKIFKRQNSEVRIQDSEGFFIDYLRFFSISAFSALIRG